MKVIFTASALQDLDEIRSYLKSNYPTIAGLVEKRLRTTITRIST
jgi:plasmid stabilization system protein ParE